MDLKDSGSTVRALGVTGGIGFMMAACVLGGYFVGSYLDSKLGTAPWLLITFLLMGLAAGFIEIYNIIKKLNKDADKKTEDK